jgi:hypothetical protein
MTELDKWNEIIEDLRGTCKSMEEVLDNYNREDLRDNMEFLGYLDNEIFRCDCCRWWCEISEESGVGDGELVCNDCEENYES